MVEITVHGGESVTCAAAPGSHHGDHRAAPIMAESVLVDHCSPRQAHDRGRVHSGRWLVEITVYFGEPVTCGDATRPLHGDHGGAGIMGLGP
jgi:hypothetical protein